MIAPPTLRFLARLVTLVAVAVSTLWLWEQHPADVAPGKFVLVHLVGLGVLLAATSSAFARAGGQAPERAAAASVVTALVALIAAPVLATRAMEKMDPPDARVWSERMWEPAPELGEGQMKLKRNVRDAVAVVPDRPILRNELTGVALDDRIKRRRTFRVNTNSEGMRGTAEIELPKTRFRMVCLGSSVTFGHGVEDDEAWCARVGASLGIEALNGGMPGRSLPAVAKWAAEHAAAIDPDLVLLSETPLMGDFNGGLADYVAVAKSLQTTFPKARFAIVLSPTSPFVAMQGPDGMPPDRAPSFATVLPGIPVLDTTQAIWAASAKRGGLTIVNTRGVQQLVDRDTGHVLVEAVGDTLSPDICAAFERDATLRVPLFIDTAHVDAEGHEIMAEAVTNWLRGQHLVPG